MKTNTIFILINELEESSFNKMPRQKTPQINFQQLVGTKSGSMRQFCMEDVFVGSNATWTSIKERVEEYQELALLRDGKLEIIYCSAFDSVTRMYTNNADDYFHFYDACIQRDEIEQLVNSFPSTFDCSFINRSNEDISKLELHRESSEKGGEEGLLDFDFLKISNISNNIVLA